MRDVTSVTTPFAFAAEKSAKQCTNIKFDSLRAAVEANEGGETTHANSSDQDGSFI